MRNLKLSRDMGSFYLSAIFLAYAIVILFSAHAPLLQDYPDWVYQGVLFQHRISGHLDPGYVLNSFPVPNSLTTVALGMLNFVAGWSIAAKVWLVLLFVFAIYAMRRFERALGQPTGWTYFLAPTFVVLNMSFWTGNINFQFGVCLVLLWVAILAENRKQQMSNTDVARLSLVLTSIFFCHMIACAVAILFLALFVVQTQQYRLIISILPSAALTVWYKIGLIVAQVRPADNADGAIRYASPAFFLYKANGYLKALGCTNVVTPGNHSSITLMLLKREGFVVFVLLHGLLGGCLLLLGWRGFRGRYPTQEDLRFLWRGLLVLVVLSVLAPSFWLGVFNPGYRLLQLAIAVGVFLAVPASADTSRRLVVCTAAIAVTCGVLNFLQFAAVQRNPLMQGALDQKLPRKIVTQLSWVAPAIRSDYYVALRRGVMEKPIFNSGLFHSTAEGGPNR